jgi:hypothetical protein
MNGRLLENLNLIEGWPAQDTNGGLTSDYVNLAPYKRCVVIFAAGAGTGDSVLTFRQAKDVADTGGKSLLITTFYSKAATTDLTGTGAWTKNTQAAAATVTVASWAAKDKLCAVEVHAEELDDANGFTCLRVAVSGASATTYGYLLFLVGDPRFPSAPENLQSAIV